PYVADMPFTFDGGGRVASLLGGNIYLEQSAVSELSFKPVGTGIGSGNFTGNAAGRIRNGVSRFYFKTNDGYLYRGTVEGDRNLKLTVKELIEVPAKALQIFPLRYKSSQNPEFEVDDKFDPSCIFSDLGFSFKEERKEGGRVIIGDSSNPIRLQTNF